MGARRGTRGSAIASLLLVRCGGASQWTQLGGDVDGESARDYAGGTQGALAMSADGTAIAVGASGHDGGGENAGHVRVFDLAVGSWSQRGADIRGERAGDRSGSSVAMSADGRVVAVGEPDSEAGHTGRFEKDFGQARVFEWRDGAWARRGQPIGGVDAYDRAAGHGGLALDAAGDTLVVGAAAHAGPAGSGAGHVRVFDYDGDGDRWVQRGEDLDGHAPGDWFGVAVSVDSGGTTVAVGALFDDGDAEAGAFGCVACRGSARVYEWSAGAWAQRGRDIDGARDGDKSGSAVALNGAGDVVAVGSPRSSASFDAAPGSAAVYAWDGAAWRPRGGRIESEDVGDLGGATLAISATGDTVAVGAYLNDGGSDAAGRVRVLDWGGEAWAQRGGDLDGENRYDYSGYSLAMSASGDVVASGARYTADAGYFAGHARVFGWVDDAPDPAPTGAPSRRPAADACGDGRFEEPDDGKRHKKRIAKFRASAVASIELCNSRCAETAKCRGTEWKPSSKKPCRHLKGSRRKTCAKKSVCCSLVST